MDEMKRSAGSREALGRIKRRYLEQASRKTGVSITLEHSRSSSRWARTGDRWIAITASKKLPQGGWWLGLDWPKVEKRQIVGAILLCESGKEVLDFGFSGESLKKLAAKLSRDRDRGEIKLAVQPSGDRYFLRIPGEDSIEVTSALGDLSWLPPPAPSRRATPPLASAELSATERAFFARVRNGVLEPLDAPDFRDGEFVVVRAARVASVPGNATLRRMLAAGGPTSLPADFAERHDAYAHGEAGQ